MRAIHGDPPRHPRHNQSLAIGDVIVAKTFRYTVCVYTALLLVGELKCRCQVLHCCY